MTNTDVQINAPSQIAQPSKSAYIGVIYCVKTQQIYQIIFPDSLDQLLDPLLTQSDPQFELKSTWVLKSDLGIGMNEFDKDIVFKVQRYMENKLWPEKYPNEAVV